MKIAINGAGIAGPTLAWWLLRAGHDITLIESAPQLRTGGYVIDFWGVGYDIAEKMGLVPRIRSLGYQVREVRLVDRNGRRNGGFSAEAFSRLTNGRFTSVARSDLAATIYGALEGKVETLFDDSIAAIEDGGDDVRVELFNSPTRHFDLVIGSGGLHSRVRKLVFGPEDQFEVPLGFHVAAFQAKGYPHRDELVYVGHAVPGRQISRLSMRDDKTMFLFVFRDEYLRGVPVRTEQRKQALAEMFAGAGWETPDILKAMHDAEDLYFDRVSQIRMNRWTQGRVALVGDAAACVSLLAGEGTGLAMAEAYVLAGEINAARSDYAKAFARYECLMMPFLKRKQSSAASFAGTFAPKTAFGIQVRNAATRLLRIPRVAEYLIGRDLRDDISLPDYPRIGGSPPSLA